MFEKMKGEAGKKEEQVWILCFFPFFLCVFLFLIRMFFQVVLWESGLPAVMTLLRKTMGASLSRALRDFREHIRGLETRRGTEGWNCAQYLIAQEGLASVLEKSSHWQEAKATLEQAEAVVCEEMKSVGFPKLWQSEDAGLCSAASSEGREKIHRSESSAFQALSYVAGRQLQMIARHDTPEAVLKRAAFVIKVQRKRAMQLQKQNEEWSRVWAANAWREVADLLPAGDSAWAVLALRNAAEYDGDWSVVARSGARRAQTEGRYRSGQTSSAGVDEGWTLLRSCTLLQEAKQRIARGEPELSVEAPELLLLEKKEKLEDGSVRVWLDKDVSVLVVLPPPPQKPVSEDVTKSPPPSHTSSSVVAEPAVVALPDPPSLSMSFSSKLEARASVVSPGVVQVRVCCDDEAVLSVNGTTGSSLLAPSDVFEVSVKTASGRIVSVKVEHESDTASVSSDSISCCLTHAAELHVGDWAQFVVCTRLSANGIVFIDGGDDWTLVGRTVASVPSGEQTLSYLASPRRAGLLLLPRPHVKQHLTKCEGMRAVRVSPLKATACATRPGRRDDEDEEEQSIGVVSSPDPKMLRYSAPPRINK